jgi:hypothetical protein
LARSTSDTGSGTSSKRMSGTAIVPVIDPASSWSCYSFRRSRPETVIA